MKENARIKTNSIWDIDRPKSVKDRIVETIIGGIADGHLTVGSPLPSETVLCKETGYSRVALREAIKQLEALGFLRIERGNGTIVTRPDFQCIGMVVESLGKTQQISLKDLHELRMMIEVEAVGMVAANHDDVLIINLEEILTEAEQNIDKEFGYVDLDFKFHKEILEACPNKLLPMLMAPFDSYLKKSRKLSFAGIEAARNTMMVHREIIVAIRQKDPVKARILMKEHLLKTARDLNVTPAVSSADSLEHEERLY
jgi:GntR family transcriptional regulator, transcriptional repressor for pyruvate dehydrogenase complex